MPLATREAVAARQRFFEKAHACQALKGQPSFLFRETNKGAPEGMPPKPGQEDIVHCPHPADKLVLLEDHRRIAAMRPDGLSRIQRSDLP